MTDRDSEIPFFRTGDTPLTGRVYLLIPCAAALWFQSNVQDALAMLSDPRFWSKWGSVDIDEAVGAGADMFLEVRQVIGWIFPYITASAPDGTLPCDGGLYNRVDYPILYGMLDSALIVDADTFRTPDLRGRTVIGTGSGPGLTPRSFNTQVGEENHTLIESEIPAHVHTTGNSITALALAPGELPVLAPNPIPTVTGSTGGSGSHNNMQPSTALKYCVVAG